MAWASGYLTCLGCGEKHVGAWPVGAEPLRCPYCLKWLCVPVDGAGFGDLPFEGEAS